MNLHQARQNCGQAEYREASGDGSLARGQSSILGTLIASPDSYEERPCTYRDLIVLIFEGRGYKDLLVVQIAGYEGIHPSQGLARVYSSSC